jgi:trehalose-6-phosphate synthase
LAERRQRHAANFKVLLANDISRWAERFLATLEQKPVLAETRSVARAALAG